MKLYILVEYDTLKWKHWTYAWDQLRHAGWKVRICRPIQETEIDKLFHKESK